MEYKVGKEKLGFPESFRFGIEIEVNNTNTKKLYNSSESKKFLKNINWDVDRHEVLVRHGGAECVSGILEDNEETWENLSKICEHVKCYPRKKGEKVVADEKCGCHVHFDATELKENPEIMKNFLQLWIESEELIYKMCNEKDNPIRHSAINMPITNLGSKSKNTIEFRMSNGSINPETIKKMFIYMGVC